MVEVRSENALESGMDLGEQAANAVAGLSDLGGEIIVEAACSSRIISHFHLLLTATLIK